MNHDFGKKSNYFFWIPNNTSTNLEDIFLTISISLMESLYFLHILFTHKTNFLADKSSRKVASHRSHWQCQGHRCHTALRWLSETREVLHLCARPARCSRCDHDGEWCENSIGFLKKHHLSKRVFRKRIVLEKQLNIINHNRFSAESSY